MSKVTITKVFQSEKETKFGPKVSVGLKIEEPNVTDLNGESVDIKDRYINGWFPKGYEFPFQEGDIVNVIVTERGEYLDFKIPEGSTLGEGSITARVLKLERLVKTLMSGNAGVEVVESTPTKTADEASASDIVEGVSDGADESDPDDF